MHGPVRDSDPASMPARILGRLPPALIRFFARRYVAGDSLERAISVALDLLDEFDVDTTLDLLSEAVSIREHALANIRTTLRVIDHASTREFPRSRRPTVSIKLSSYVASPPRSKESASFLRESLASICRHALFRGVGLTIDMEERRWTDTTLKVLNSLHDSGYSNVGCVLQTRLHRTVGDLDGLPTACRVRLVIGVYDEPETVATRDKNLMKRRMVEYGKYLVDRGHYVEMATHDIDCINTFVKGVGGGSRKFEIQMLYGVPRANDLHSLRRKGLKTRLYVPFAQSWSEATAYLRRRLIESPAIVLPVLRNHVARIVGR